MAQLEFHSLTEFYFKMRIFLSTVTLSTFTNRELTAVLVYQHPSEWLPGRYIWLSDFSLGKTQLFS